MPKDPDQASGFQARLWSVSVIIAACVCGLYLCYMCLLCIAITFCYFGFGLYACYLCILCVATVSWYCGVVTVALAVADYANYLSSICDVNFLPFLIALAS